METPSVGFVKVSLLQNTNRNQLIKMAEVMIEMDLDSEEVDLRNADEEKDQDTSTKTLVRLQ